MERLARSHWIEMKFARSNFDRGHKQTEWADRDTPIIARYLRDNATCAVSGTGDGEYFIMATAAHDVSTLMEYRRKTVEEASVAVIDKNRKTWWDRRMIQSIKAAKSATVQHLGNVSGICRSKRQVHHRDLSLKFVTRNSLHR